MRALLKEKLAEALGALGLPSVDFSLERPRLLEHGDYASNIALAAAKIANRPPMEIAEALVKMLEKSDIQHIARVHIAAPGFLNFTLLREALAGHVRAIIKEGNAYGRSSALKGERVVIEYTDTNPFKEMHIGHLMSNSIGEALSRVLEFSGAEVIRANYQGDVGLHVAKAVWASKNTTLPDLAATSREKMAFWGEMYQEGDHAYEEGAAADKPAIEHINREIYEGGTLKTRELYAKGRADSLEHFAKIYQRLGTHFNECFFESETWQRGKAMVEEYLQKGVFEKSDGAVVFRGEPYGLHTRVFITAGGLPTYEAKDMGLMVIKEERLHPARSLVVTGNEVVEYFKVVREAMRQINPALAEKTEHVPHGMLRLKSGKMSSRKGNVIAAETLLDEVAALAEKKMKESGVVAEEDRKAVADSVAVAAVKYSILRQSIGRDILFDTETSLSFEGDSGPYLQYTYARARSVLRKAEEVRLKISAENPSEAAHALERELVHFPEVVSSSLTEYAPQYLCTFLFSLAQTFNHFYAAERIVEGGDEAPWRIALTAAVAATLKNGLWLLGIQAPEKM